MVLTVVRLLTQWGKLIQTTCCMYTVREKTKHSPTRPSACSCCLGFTLKAVGQVENKKQLVSHRNLKKPEVDPSDCSSPPDCGVSHEITVSDHAEYEGCPSAQVMDPMLEVMSEIFSLTN